MVAVWHVVCGGLGYCCGLVCCLSFSVGRVFVAFWSNWGFSCVFEALFLGGVDEF